MARITTEWRASGHERWGQSAADGLVGSETKFSSPSGSGPATILRAEVIHGGDALRLTLEAPDELVVGILERPMPTFGFRVADA